MKMYVRQILYFLVCFIAFNSISCQQSNEDEISNKSDEILPEMHITTDLPYKIRGPKSKHDKIAIVGAGPSGIHMAYMLKKLGYTNLHILEKADRVGGKSTTIPHRGVNHDIGTVYVGSDYQNSIIPLAKKYLPNQLISFPPQSVWLEPLSAPITFPQFVVSFIGGVLKESNITLIEMKVILIQQRQGLKGCLIQFPYSTKNLTKSKMFFL